MKLGLDLRGGVYLVYQVDVQGAVKQLLDRHEQDFRASLRNARVPYQDVAVDYPSYRVRVLFRDADSLAKGKAALLADSRNLALTETTVDGAPTLELKLSPQEIKERQDYAVQQNIVILRNRLNSPELAVSEPQVAREGVDRISIQLPGLQNSAEVKKILGKTATLEFRMVDETNNPLEAAAGRVPLGSKLYYTRDKQPVLLKREVVVTGDQLTDASFQPNTQEGAAVSVSLDSRGAAKMLKNTQENLGHLMAVVFIDRSREKNAEGVVVDRTSEEVINRATIRGVFSNNFQITGVNPIEGRELALLLRAGGLAAPVTPIQERAIGPSLGQDNIDKGVHAMVFGMLAAFIFMAVYYKVFGLIADLTLVANVVLLTALLSMLGGVALTLPGIAAVVLTVGMAVDANILIYERIREELRNGVSPRAAITAGFDRAFSAIADSNVTAFIAGLVLWLFGAGAVRGFAVVLMLGIATSMFTAVMGSRALVQIIYGGKRKVDHLSI